MAEKQKLREESDGLSGGSSSKSAIGEAIAEVSGLFSAARAMLKAEKIYAKRRLAYARHQAFRMIIYGATAIMLMMLLMIAITVGCLLMLTEMFGPLIATFVLAGALLFIMVVFVISAARAAKNVKSPTRG